jgi:RNA polymerase sigma-70 factor (ECF subfamily)
MDPDRFLVERLRAGDSGALELAYRAHGARVYRLCLRLLLREPEAEDATQEVFLRCLERIQGFDGRARFTTWLHRLTTNHCLHRLEREELRRAEPLPELDHEPGDGAASPLEHAARAEARETLATLLARLSSEHRSVLVLREIEQLSYAEIARTLAIPEGTVMSRLARAREQLVRLGAGCAARTGTRPETPVTSRSTGP